MNIDTALRHRDRIVRRIIDLYSSIVHTGPTSRDLNKMSEAIHGSLPARAPEWVRQYCRGYEAALRAAATATQVFCYCIDGNLYSTHRDRDDYYEKHGLDAKQVYDKAVASGHYWSIAGQRTGSVVAPSVLKPYFVSEK